MIPNIDQVRTLGEIQSTVHWQVIMSPPSGVHGDSGSLDLRAISSDIPKVTGKATELSIRGHKVKYPGIPEVAGSIELTFVESINQTITKTISDWRQLCYNVQTGAMGSKARVTGTVILRRLARDGSTVVWTYELIGAFLEDYTVPKLQGTQDENYQASMRISYDYFTEHS